MATFRSFLRLPLELRIQIWASVCDDGRVVKVRWTHPTGIYWSPTTVPAVTRVCRESRKYCSYQKSFIHHASFIAAKRPHYIWVNFVSDILQMPGSVMARNMAQEHSDIFNTRRLRVEVVTEIGLDEPWDNASDDFFHDYSHQISKLPKLEACDVLVKDGLRNWGSFIHEHYWGTCPKSNVRMIDASTGEWIDMNTAGAYVDWMDNYMGIDPDDGPVNTRIDDCWDAEDEEDVKSRYEAMMRMKEGLLCIDLDY